MNPLECLLELQERDTRIAQLEHRLKRLPERAELSELTQRAEEFDGRIEAAGRQRLELERSQRKGDHELTDVVERRSRERNLLYSGEVTGIRELQALEGEVAALAKRQEVLEDRLLEVMEQIETLDAEVAELRAARGAVTEQMGQVTTRLEAAEAEIEVACSQVRSDREAAAAEVAAELLGRYEQLRRMIGGVAVARLVDKSCTGCHLALPLVEVDRLRRLPEVGEAPAGCDDKGSATCPSCERILVI